MMGKLDWEFLYSSDNKIELNALELLYAETDDRMPARSPRPAFSGKADGRFSSRHEKECVSTICGIGLFSV